MSTENRTLLVNDDGITSFRDFADIAEILMVLELKEKLLAGWSTAKKLPENPFASLVKGVDLTTALPTDIVVKGPGPNGLGFSLAEVRLALKYDLVGMVSKDDAKEYEKDNKSLE